MLNSRYARIESEKRFNNNNKIKYIKVFVVIVVAIVTIRAALKDFERQNKECAHSIAVDT